MPDEGLDLGRPTLRTGPEVVEAVSPTARTRSWAPARRSISASASSSRPSAANRGASLGCRATPATRASCCRAASTAQAAPGRSQPICTMRLYADLRGPGDRVRRVHPVAVGDVEVTVVVDHGVRQRLGRRRPLPVAPLPLLVVGGAAAHRSVGAAHDPTPCTASYTTRLGTPARLATSTIASLRLTRGLLARRRPPRRLVGVVVDRGRRRRPRRPRWSPRRARRRRPRRPGRRAAPRRTSSWVLVSSRHTAAAPVGAERLGHRRPAPPPCGAAPRRTTSVRSSPASAASRRRALARPCGAGSPRSRTGRPAARRPPARSAPPTGPGTAVTGDAAPRPRPPPAGSPGRRRSASRRR